MALWDKIRHELIEIIEWTDNTPDTMVYKFPVYENEIKNGAKLVVRESQAAVFLNEGTLADVFKPGTYSLVTQNLPVLARLKGWKYGFESPFKADVFFLSTRVFTDRKWGTKNPIMLRDADFGLVRLRAFGTFAIKITDPAAFVRQIAGTEARFTLDQIEEQLRDLVCARFADALGSSKIAALDLAGNYDKIGGFIAERIQKDFEAFGLHIVNLLVENVSMPPEVEAALDKRTSMGVIGNMGQYTQFQTANAIPDAAKNPGGLAGSAAGLAMGINMANTMQQGIAAGVGAGAAAMVPPPLPAAVAFYVAINGQQAGPFDATALQAKAAAGQVTRQTLAWKPGMAAWLPAGDVPELAPLFATVPPPLPST